MARGPRLHLKRLFAPKDWMLSKLTGVFAPRPRGGPHKIRECLPLLVILRNRLKYALNAREGQMILRQRLVKVDGRVRIDPKFPAGFMDVVEIPKSGDRFRLLYDVKGRFAQVKVGEAEGNVKLCKVTDIFSTTGRVPVASTHDGRRIRYPPAKASIGDSLLVDTTTGKVNEVVKMRAGKVAMLTGGANRGRVGEIVRVEKHPGAFDIAHLKDKNGHEFATRARNVFVLGHGYDKLPITLPKQQGIKIAPVEERNARLVAAETRKSAHSKGHKKSKK